MKECSEWELVVMLRRLIFGKINNNIIRLYSEVDPTLGKILRNLKLALKRSNLFEEVTRFGDEYLVPRGIAPLFHLPPVQIDFIRRELSRIVLLHDTVPEMMKKLHTTVSEQEEYQRAVSLVSAGVLFKEIYSLAWESQPEINVVEEKMEADHLVEIVKEICRELHTNMSHSYVGKGKCSQEIFEKYMEAVKNILQGYITDDHLDGSTFYEYLQIQIPALTKENYKEEHRVILEYLVKIGKERLKTQLTTL